MSVENATEKLNKILGGGQQQEENEDDDEEGGYRESFSSEEARSSDTAEYAVSPKGGYSREEPLLEEDQQPQSQPQSQLEQSQPQSQPDKETEEDSSSQSASLLQTRTTSSSISEDPTFNSYAASELSSMMSHLEIQALLKQGRQQQHDAMMAAAAARGAGGMIAPIPEVIERDRSAGSASRSPQRPTMVLYANQSLGIHGGPPSLREARPLRPGSPLQQPMQPTMRPGSPMQMPIQPMPTGRDFSSIQSSPSISSSSQFLLQRTDAMEDTSVSNNYSNMHAPQAPPRSSLYSGLEMEHAPQAAGRAHRSAPPPPPPMPLSSISGRGMQEVHYPIPQARGVPYQGGQRQQRRDSHELQQQYTEQSEQFYPHLLVQNSTLTSMPDQDNELYYPPSMTSTITTVQDGALPYGPSNYPMTNGYAVYQRQSTNGSTGSHNQVVYQRQNTAGSAGSHGHQGHSTTYSPLNQSPILAHTMTPPSTREDDYQSLKNATPLSCGASVSTPSVITENTPDGHAVKVEVEVGLVKNTDVPKIDDFVKDVAAANKYDTSPGNGDDRLLVQKTSTADDHTIETATSQRSKHSLAGAESYRSVASSATGRKSVQSLLGGASTKSLADELLESSDEHVEDSKESDHSHSGSSGPGEDGEPRSAGEPVGAESNVTSSAAVGALRWNQGTQHYQNHPLAMVPQQAHKEDDFDGYSADRSTSYTLGAAHDISEQSTVGGDGNSYFGLQRGLPMNVDSEDTDENNSHLRSYGGGYGHAFNNEPLPPMANPSQHQYQVENGGSMFYVNKPVIPPSFPSLMDSSISSAFTETTAPSIRTPSPTLGVTNIGYATSSTIRRHSEEEREDSLPKNDIIGLQGFSGNVNNGISQGGSVGGPQRTDPLTATTSNTSARLNNNNHSPQPQPVVMIHHHAPPAPAMNDPRMNIDYERHYIVDLEPVNEESSENRTNDLSSTGRGMSASISSPRKSPLSSPRALSPDNSGPKMMTTSNSHHNGRDGMGKNFDTIPEGYNNTNVQQQPQTTQPMMMNHHPSPAAAAKFYDYRHQYYTEQYHYCDDRFSQSSNHHRNSSSGGDYDDETNSTCSSVTLSQAFHQPENDGMEDSCASSMTDECYSESPSMTPSLGSSVSSVTVSRALSCDKHEHSGQGFYVATRLGDFVEIPTGGEETSEEGLDGDGVLFLEDEHDHAAEAAKTAYEEEAKLPATAAIVGDGDTTTADATKSDTVKSGDGDSFTNKSSGTDDEIDAVSDVTAAPTGGADNKGNGTQVTKPADSVESDIISALVPECGVPIPSVMAKVGETATAQRTTTHRVRSGKGGMLLPWHSTRSIQNYHNSGRRGKKNKPVGVGGRGGASSGSNSLYSSRSREGSSTTSIFSIASVHTFRG